MSKNICLFGLSGDPPTANGGHVGIVDAVTRMNCFDEIWIIPVYSHMFAGKRNRLVSYEHRFKMCQLAFENSSASETMDHDGLVSSDTENDSVRHSEHQPLQQSKTKVIVSDIEKQTWLHATGNLMDGGDQTGVRIGTASLLDYLFSIVYVDVDSRPNFTFCLGSDAFLDLMNGKWKDSQRILEMLQNRLLVLFRRTNSIDPESNDNTDDGHLNFLRNCINSRCPGAILLQCSHLDAVSSTSVRQCENLDLLQTMIPLAVLKYIQENHLYQFNDVKDQL